MMRLWENKENALGQALEGIMLAEPDKYLRLATEYGYGLYQKYLPPGQVRVIINGGGGYGPMWAGFAGEGLADAMVHGAFDSAPNAYVLYEMAKTIECGHGVLFLTNHFMGDYLNNDMAVELLAYDGIAAKVCYVSDDVLSCPGETKEQRGGLHGIGQICKITAAAAKTGLCLEEVYRLAGKANQRMRSLAVNVREGKMLLGEGFSGEPAAIVTDYRSFGQMVREAGDILMNEMRGWVNDSWYISVNTHRGVGYTEGLGLLHAVAKYLKQQKLVIHGGAVGNYFDVFEDSGCMISFLACDKELGKYLYPVTGYSFTI